MKKFVLVLILISIVSNVKAEVPTLETYPSILYDIYVDATTDNLWPTDAASYPSLSDWAYDATTSADVVYNKWYIKGGTTSSLSGAAIYGTAFQGCGTLLPQLTMDSGDVLDPAKTYNVYAVGWCRNDTEYWYFYAGLDGDQLWLCDSITEYDNIFSTGTFVIDGCQLFLGQVSGVSSVSVNVDGPNVNDGGKRAWFDGLAFVETTPGPYVTLTVAANITDPQSAAVNPLDDSSLNLSYAVGQHTFVQGKRILIEAEQSASCPDIYDFISFTGDLTGTVSPATLKMDSNKSVTVNYEVIEYTPVCGGDVCHPYLKGDTNDDCKVDFTDLFNMASNWLQCTKPECD